MFECRERMAGSASITYSIPLFGERSPKVSSTVLPSTPNRSLKKFESMNGMSITP